LRWPLGFGKICKTPFYTVINNIINKIYEYVLVQSPLFDLLYVIVAK